jgi:Trk-type K+ transport system membrane component
MGAKILGFAKRATNEFEDFQLNASLLFLHIYLFSYISFSILLLLTSFKSETNPYHMRFEVFTAMSVKDVGVQSIATVKIVPGSLIFSP